MAIYVDERRGAWLIGWIDQASRVVKRVGVYNSPPSFLTTNYSTEWCAELAFVAGPFEEARPKMLKTLATAWGNWCRCILDANDRAEVEKLRAER